VQSALGKTWSTYEQENESAWILARTSWPQKEWGGGRGFPSRCTHDVGRGGDWTTSSLRWHEVGRADDVIRGRRLGVAKRDVGRDAARPRYGVGSNRTVASNPVGGHLKNRRPYAPSYPTGVQRGTTFLKE